MAPCREIEQGDSKQRIFVYLLRNDDISVGGLKGAVGYGHSGLRTTQGVAAVQQRDQKAWTGITLPTQDRKSRWITWST